MKKDELIKHTIEIVKFIFIIALVYVVFLLAFRFVPFLSRYDHYVILTGSMEPTIDVGEIVIIDTEISPKELVEGDIVAFYIDLNNDGEDEVVVHYIDEVIPYGIDTLRFKTHSEVSDTQDPWTVEESDIIGIYAYQFDSIGKLLLFANSLLGKIVIILDIVLLYMFVQYIKKPNQKETDKISTESDIIKIEDEDNQ